MSSYTTTERDEDGRTVARTERTLTPAERDALIRQRDAGRRAAAEGRDWGQAIADEMERGPVVGYAVGHPAEVALDEDGVPVARYRS